MLPEYTNLFNYETILAFTPKKFQLKLNQHFWLTFSLRDGDEAFPLIGKLLYYQKPHMLFQCSAPVYGDFLWLMNIESNNGKKLCMLPYELDYKMDSNFIFDTGLFIPECLEENDEIRVIAGDVKIRSTGFQHMGILTQKFSGFDVTSDIIVSNDYDNFRCLLGMLSSFRYSGETYYKHDFLCHNSVSHDIVESGYQSSTYMQKLMLRIVSSLFNPNLKEPYGQSLRCQLYYTESPNHIALKLHKDDTGESHTIGISTDKNSYIYKLKDRLPVSIQTHKELLNFFITEEVLDFKLPKEYKIGCRFRRVL